MNAFVSFLEAGFFQAAWAERMGWTLLHSLWQIALLAGVYAALALLLRNRSASARYVVGCVTLLAMLGLPVSTYVLLSRDAPPLAVAHVERASTAAMPPVEFAESQAQENNPAEPGVPSAAPHKSTNSEIGGTLATGGTVVTDLLSPLRPYLPWATAAWFAGVLLLALRPLWGWLHVRRLQRHGLLPLSESLHRVGQHLMRQFRVNRAVRFAQSALVEVPTVVGYLRPLVLLPASAIAGLSTLEIEMILAHELAHVRRHDYLVNLVQTVIEALLFYHPSMWYVSSQIRRERENCCDDLAVAVGGSRTNYVRALARLEEQRWATPAAVLAATGGSLLARVRRLLGQPHNEFGYRNATALLAGLMTIGLAAALAMSGEPRKDRVAPPEAAIEAGELSAAISDRVVRLIESSNLPFMTDERLKEIRAEIAALVKKHQRDDLSDDRKQAILAALDTNGAVLLQLDRYRPDEMQSLNQPYLTLPDRLRTIEWKLFMALTRNPLSFEERERREEQRQWMRDHVGGLPETRFRTHQRALEDLEGRFRDPLCVVLDRPMTEQQFEAFQEKVQRFPRDRELTYVVPHIVANALNVIYRDSKGFRLPFDDHVGSYGSANGYVQLGFESTALFHGDTRYLCDMEKDYAVVDATTGGWVSAPPQEREPEKFRNWLEQQGKGDFAFTSNADGGMLVSVRGAKLARLGVENWLEADAVSDKALRALLETRGKETISLTGAYEAHRDQHKTYPPTVFIGPYIGILTKEGRLAVVHIEDFSGPKMIHYRTRPRARSIEESARDTGSAREQFSTDAAGAADSKPGPHLRVTTNPVGIQSAMTAFGPVMERVLTGNFTKATSFLDLDTGKHVDPQRDGSRLPAQQLRRMGIDLYMSGAESNSNSRTVLDMVVGQLWETAWSDSVNWTPDEARKNIARNLDGRRPSPGRVIGAPGTYAFRTREGSIGILELVAPKENQQDMMVRYKLLREPGHLTIDDAAWGDVVDGLQVQLVPDDASWKLPETPTLKVFLRKQGAQDLWLPTNSDFGCQLEVDGKWYEHGGDRITGPPYLGTTGYRKPGTILIRLSEAWKSVDDHQPLRLAPGKHTVRFAWPGHYPLPGKEHTPDKARPVRLASNAVEIEMVAAVTEQGDAGAGPPTEDPAGKTSQKSKPAQVELEGRVVDDETGKPVEQFAMQWGWPKSKGAKEIGWGGVAMSGSLRRDGRFHENMSPPSGSKVGLRILADGYVPQPVTPELVTAPASIKGLVVRLRRGETVRGRVLDHAGKPVAGAGIYLAGHQPIQLDEGPQDHGQKAAVHTDAEGRFEIRGRGHDAKAIIVSCPSLFVWRADLPKAGEALTIRLPEPARLELRYDIEGGPPEADVRIKLRTWGMKEWKGLVNAVRWVHVPRGGEGLVIDNLPPGVYDVSRIKQLRGKQSGRRPMLDRNLTLTLESGTPTEYSFVRDKAAPISGEVVGLPKENVEGVFLYVKDARAGDDPRGRDDSWKLTVFDALALEGNGTFQTERILPGKYKIVVEAYPTETAYETGRLGLRPPFYVGAASVTVPESGQPPKVRVEMKTPPPSPK